MHRYDEVCAAATLRWLVERQGQIRTNAGEMRRNIGVRGGHHLGARVRGQLVTQDAVLAEVDGENVAKILTIMVPIVGRLNWAAQKPCMCSFRIGGAIVPAVVGAVKILSVGELLPSQSV